MRIRPLVKIPSFQVDWPNHIIGFFSALFGILIAFQLDEWREQRAQKELVAAAYSKLKSEVEDNRARLNATMDENMALIQSIEKLLTKVDESFHFTGTREEADSINQRHGDFAFVVKPASGKGRPEVRIWLIRLVIPALETAGWESSKATGALNYMNYEMVSTFSSVYNNPEINTEIDEIRDLWRRTDDYSSKREFQQVISELRKAHQVIMRKLPEYDQWISIISNMQ